MRGRAWVLEVHFQSGRNSAGIAFNAEGKEEEPVPCFWREMRVGGDEGNESVEQTAGLNRKLEIYSYFSPSSTSHPTHKHSLFVCLSNYRIVLKSNDISL